MSDIHIGLVSEGPLDYIIIKAALTAILRERSFILNQLYPESPHPRFGGGWCGVLKWCRETGKQDGGNLDSNPLLSYFDLLVIQIDADVASKNYSDCGRAIEDEAIQLQWKALPCVEPCPPISDTTRHLPNLIGSWLHPALLGTRSVLCIPAQTSGTWLTYSKIPEDHPLLENGECKSFIELDSSNIPKIYKIGKSRVDYNKFAHLVSENWDRIKSKCTQAALFEAGLQRALESIR